MRIPILLFAAATAFAAEPVTFDYKVLATNRTSTMEKELNDAAAAGYSFMSAMGGESAFGGKEVVVVMGKDSASKAAPKKYKLLATQRTSTMQKEMSAAAVEGFRYLGQTVFDSAFGGKQVAVIMEHDAGSTAPNHEYRLLATSKTSTMQKELSEAGAAGYRLLGMTVGGTAMGGNELVCILAKDAAK